MNESEYWYSKSSRDANQSDREYEAKLAVLIEHQEYNLISILHPKILKDGDQWCVVYGENIQQGIVGWGKTPYLAILDFNKSFRSK